MDYKNVITEAVDALRLGKPILCPADTIWGLSCDATNQEAVSQIYELKKRSLSKSMVVLVNSDSMINQSIKEIPEVAWDLIDLADKPLSIIMDATTYLAPNVVHEDGSVAIRMVKSGFIYDLLQKFRKPIVSTSPNFSGDPTPLSFKDINADLVRQIDHVVPEEFDKDLTGAPSKIIKLSNSGEISIIRS